MSSSPVNKPQQTNTPIIRIVLEKGKSTEASFFDGPLWTVMRGLRDFALRIVVDGETRWERSKNNTLEDFDTSQALPEKSAEIVFQNSNMVRYMLKAKRESLEKLGITLPNELLED
jgi:hypothetical protein